MIVIYDFDGTLTPYPIPKYEILSKCNFDEEEANRQIMNLMHTMGVSIYDAYYDVFKKLLMESGFAFSKEIISMGAENVTLAPGVLEYLKEVYNLGIKQYIITSGYEDYVKNTPVAKYMSGIYGTTFSDVDGDGKLDRILSEEDKVKFIKQICEDNNQDLSSIIYIGDGLTDKEAFKTVHDGGGKTIFVGMENDAYEALNSYTVIDEKFARNYSSDTDLYKYLMSLLKK